MNTDNVVIATLHSAPSDSNGNPRSVWVFCTLLVDGCELDGMAYGWTHMLYVRPQGYGSLRDALGAFRLRGHNQAVVVTGPNKCTPTEYKELIRWPGPTTAPTNRENR